MPSLDSRNGHRVNKITELERDFEAALRTHLAVSLQLERGRFGRCVQRHHQE